MFLKSIEHEQIEELAQAVACRAVKSEVLGSLPSGSATRFVY